MWLGATPAHEAAYLEQWRQCTLAVERTDSEQLMQIEHEEEEERRARDGAAQTTVQPSQQGDVARAWEAAFPWAGPVPELFDLTGPGSYDEDA